MRRAVQGQTCTGSKKSVSSLLLLSLCTAYVPSSVPFLERKVKKRLLSDTNANSQGCPIMEHLF